MYNLCTLAALLLAKQAHGSDNQQTMILPNSCADLPDGDHWLKLLDGEDYPPVEVFCSNGYTMIDVNKDENLISYFSSWAKWHYGIAGPTNDDHVNWAQWYIPDDGDTSYLVSPTCDVCDETDTVTNDLASDTTYYMTGNLYGCWWWLRGLHDCDMDWESYECFACECTDGACHGASLTDSDSMTGICATNTRSATAKVATTHDMCTRDTSWSYKPSLGTDGRFCQCVKPAATQYYEVDATLVDEIVVEEEDEGTGSIDDQYELYQEDFEIGTYRILRSGTYTIMEDIEFDFNAGESNEDGAWLPHDDQLEDYPGAGQYRDPFFMGFFAGITVEAPNVIIELNGHTLKQSQAFYYQQRWFSIIELANQPFMPGQGPGFFGGDPVVANGIEIRNGVLGLTSHHGIHGNRAKNINIHDITVRDFETHGIQLNGFENLEIVDVEIMESSQQAFLLGEYGHARMLLPRLRKIAEENPTEGIKFYGRDKPLKMDEIVAKLEKQVDLAFEYVMYGTEISRDDDQYELWLKAKENFINEDGIPYGSGMYGIFLSYPGANVFGYGHSNLKSKNARIEIPFYVNPFNAVFDVGVAASDPTDLDNAHYIGNIMTDAYLAMNKMSDNWGYLQMQMLKNDGLVAWAVGSKPLADDITLTCNADVMTHSGKGIAGFRVDGVIGVKANNIEIYDLYDYTPLGTSQCGEYEAGGGNINGGHFLQKRPMQTGFSGHMVQGVTTDYCEVEEFGTINVHDIGSANGLAFGIAVWPGTDITITGELQMSNIRAGFQTDVGDLDYSSRPNAAPEACGMRVYWQYNKDSVTLSHSSGMIRTSCVAGHVGCFNIDDYDGSMLGKYTQCTDTQLSPGDVFMGDFDRYSLKTKDTSSQLSTFNTRDTSLSPASSAYSFKSISNSKVEIAQGPNSHPNKHTNEDFDADIDVDENNNEEEEELLDDSIKVTQETDPSHLLLLIVPFIGLCLYGIYSKKQFDKQKHSTVTVQYRQLSQVERPSYGTL